MSRVRIPFPARGDPGGLPWSWYRIVVNFLLKLPRRPQSHQVAGLLFLAGSCFGLKCQRESVKFPAPYPSGKGEVCKTFMRGFESLRRLEKKSYWLLVISEKGK